MIEYENLQKSNNRLFEKYKEAFEDFLNSGRFILGDSVSKFENEFALFNGNQFCVGVGSGLDALILTINAFNFPSGSEIIVPSNTYIATILAIVRNGLKPILVEPDIKTYNIDPSKIEEKITTKTKALLIVHLYGKSCDMAPILELSNRYNLELIEDAAQSHGAMYKNKKTGSFGTGCFSFYPTKNLGALGDAGAITTNNKELTHKLKKLRNYGSGIKYYNDELGYNSRLDEIQAAFLSQKLKILNDINYHKRNLADVYLKNLDERFVKPDVNKDFYDVYHIFNIRYSRRDFLREKLLQKGVMTEVHYPLPPHRQKAMKGIIDGNYPISEEIHNTTISLPIAFFHQEKDILQVCEIINSIITTHG